MVDVSQGTTFGQMATYSCNGGYELTGGATRTCQTTGWSGSAPTCGEFKTCGINLQFTESLLSVYYSIDIMSAHYAVGQKQTSTSHVLYSVVGPKTLDSIGERGADMESECLAVVCVLFTLLAPCTVSIAIDRDFDLVC